MSLLGSLCPGVDVEIFVLLRPLVMLAIRAAWIFLFFSRFLYVPRIWLTLCSVVAAAVLFLLVAVHLTPLWSRRPPWLMRFRRHREHVLSLIKHAETADESTTTARSRWPLWTRRSYFKMPHTPCSIIFKTMKILFFLWTSSWGTLWQVLWLKLSRLRNKRQLNFATPLRLG